jgi:hypothetical protein
MLTISSTAFTLEWCHVALASARGGWGRAPRPGVSLSMALTRTPARCRRPWAGLEHHLAGLVGLAVGAGHGIHVGQVAGHHVQALRLRADGAARDIEDGEHGHGDFPLSALGLLALDGAEHGLGVAVDEAQRGFVV